MIFVLNSVSKFLCQPCLHIPGSLSFPIIPMVVKQPIIKYTDVLYTDCVHYKTYLKMNTILSLQTLKYIKSIYFWLYSIIFVFIGAFLDLSSTKGQEMLTAAQLAVQEINKNVNYFPKYKVVLDTGGNSTNTVRIKKLSTKKEINCAKDALMGAGPILG